MTAADPFSAARAGRALGAEGKVLALCIGFAQVAARTRRRRRSGTSQVVARVVDISDFVLALALQRHCRHRLRSSNRWRRPARQHCQQQACRQERDHSAASTRLKEKEGRKRQPTPVFSKGFARATGASQRFDLHVPVHRPAAAGITGSSRGAPSQFSQFSVRIQYNSAIHELRTDAILKNAFCLADIFRSHSTPSHFHSITQGKECNVHDVPFPRGSCRTMPGGLGITVTTITQL